MDSIRNLALDCFHDQHFQEPPPPHYEILSIPPLSSDSDSDSRSDGPRKASKTSTFSTASIDEIQNIARTRPPFLLVQVQFEPPAPNHSFHASRADLQALTRVMNIDDCGLGLVANDTTGFHTMGSASDDEEDGDEDDSAPTRASYYLYCGAYKFLWSYDAVRQSTLVIAFMFNRDRSPRGVRAFLEFVSCLQDQAARGLATHPLLIPLSALAQSVAFTERTLRQQYHKCRIAEQGSGVHPWRLAAGPEEQGKAVRELAAIARQMTVLVLEVEMVIRRLRQWAIAIGVYEEMQDAYERRWGGAVSAKQRRYVRDALRLIKSKLDVLELDFMYARERARNQASAVTQIMTRDDTLASIELAKAAGRDGASMKVVAIMTMAFLPGTFFAALWAVPSLQWEDDAETVVGKRFWIYWAFTLPLTVLVFVLWALLTQREELATLWADVTKPRLRRRVREGAENKPEQGDVAVDPSLEPFDFMLSFVRKSPFTSRANSGGIDMSKV